MVGFSSCKLADGLVYFLILLLSVCLLHSSSGTLSFLMSKISAKLKRGYPQWQFQFQMQVQWVKIGDF